MELLQITLAANETKQFAKAGRYFEIIDSNYSITVNFTGSNGALSDSMVNALSGLFLEDPFSHFAVTNGVNAQTITLLVMESGRGGSRRQPGVVQVVDGGKTRSLANGAGIATGAQGVLASNYSFVELWNTPASGRNLFVRKVIVSSTGNQGFILTSHNAAPGTKIGFAVSKLNQNVLNAFEVWKGTNATVIGQNIMFNLTTPGAAFTVDFNEPLVLAPGFGLVALGGATGMDIYATFDLYSEPV